MKNNRRDKFFQKTGVTREVILKEAKEWVRPRTQEELNETPRLRYPGRYRGKAKKQNPSQHSTSERFVGIKIGWWY